MKVYVLVFVFVLARGTRCMHVCIMYVLIAESMSNDVRACVPLVRSSNIVLDTV